MIYILKDSVSYCISCVQFPTMKFLKSYLVLMVVAREFARSRVEQQGLQAREVPANYFQAITRKGRTSRRARETRKVLSTTTLQTPTLVSSRLLPLYQ